MPIYLKTNSIAKTGVNYLRTIVEDHNCIFQKIDQENDVGIDALIELVKDERPTGNFIAIQIKSGKSYFDKNSNRCKIPIRKHRDYWGNHSLPVYGVVYIPEYGNAYWVNIKDYLKANPNNNTIYYEPTLANIINETTFITQFIPHLTNDVPDISFELAEELFKSMNIDEFYLGLYTLFKKFADRNEVWKIFIDYFKKHSFDEIPEQLIYYLSVIPWHPDIFYYKDTYTPKSRAYGKALIAEFQKFDIEKLLLFIDEENMISRGTLGQSVEAIISSIPNFLLYLEEIIIDKSKDIKIREFAAIIFAYHKGEEGINILSSIDFKESWYVQELINHLKEYGSADLY